MNPVVHALALITALALAVALTAHAASRFDPMSMGSAALLWLGVGALAWHQWVRRRTDGWSRAAAMVGFAMLAATVHAWMQQTDVFVEYRRNCPPRPGTFWKLVLVWLAGIAAANYALLGQVFAGLLTAGRPAALNALRWCLIVLWTYACVQVFANNISADVTARSFTIAGLGAGLPILLFGSIVGGIAALVWIFSTPSRRREKQAKADYLAISETRKRELVDMVERHARGVEHAIYYREAGAPGWDIRKPHVGGSALMPVGEAWPTGADGEPALLLLQIPLPDVLPAPWPGRVLTLWLGTTAFEVKVGSYSSLEGLVEVAQPPLPERSEFSAVPKAGLLPLVLPVSRDEDDEATGDPISNLLLRDCEALRVALGALTTQPDKVLPKILGGDVRLHFLEPGDGVWVGGEPQLIQNEHDAHCDICGQPMRFLFSSGDVTEEMAFGDVGVAYIYGCDRHPEHCQGFVDCH